jgi:hypothetical protein
MMAAAGAEDLAPHRCPTCFHCISLITDVCPKCGQLVPYPPVRYECFLCGTTLPDRKTLAAHYKEPHGSRRLGD